MNYNQEIGEIYDTIFFFIEYFNQNEIKNSYINVYENTDFMVDCYNQVKSQITDIPEYLSPLFHLKDNSTSPFSMFFSGQIDFQNDNIDSFIVKVITKSDLLCKYTWQCIFENSESNDKNYSDAGTYFTAFQALNATVEYKMQISLLFGNFTYAITVLAPLLKQVYLAVDKLHKRYAKELALKFSQITGDSNLQQYQEALKYDFSELDKTEISICLLHQYVIYGPYNNSNSTFIILGYQNEEALGCFIDSSDINVDQFIINCGNELRLRILRAILEHGELTSSQLAQILGCPVTTMIRHINMLTENHLIQISRREGLQIFYKINIKLFKIMKFKVNEIFTKIINTMEESDL